MFATIPPRRLILLAAAMGLSLVTALVVHSWVENVRREATPVAVVETVKPPTMILVAAKPLPAGHFIKDEDLKWQSWPDDNMASTYLVQGAVTTDAIVGSVARSGIAIGEPITNARIVKQGERGFLAAIVTPGFRAITVTMTSNAGLSGLAIPGDRVDVLLTMTVPATTKDAADRKFTETVMQDVRVLAIDQKIDDQASDSVMAHTATLEVTPKQAETVTLLQELGKMSMTLRSVGSAENDTETHAPTVTSDSDLTALLGLRTPSKAAGTSQPSDRIEVVRGTARSIVDISGRTIQQDDQAPATVGTADKKALQAAQPVNPQPGKKQ
jgi:pilus assembly protein CpaB